MSRLKALIRDREMTLSEVANKCGISFESLHQMCNGIVKPRIKTITSLSKVLQVSGEDLLEALDENYSRISVRRSRGCMVQIGKVIRNHLSWESVINFIVTSMTILYMAIVIMQSFSS